MNDESPVVEVAYASTQEQCCLKVPVPRGSTIRGAIERSRILDRFPEIDLAKNKVGIYSRIGSLEDLVQDGDRVEIYRPLIVDPKAARRKRFEESKP